MWQSLSIVKRSCSVCVWVDAQLSGENIRGEQQSGRAVKGATGFLHESKVLLRQQKEAKQKMSGENGAVACQDRSQNTHSNLNEYESFPMLHVVFHISYVDPTARQ